MKHIIRLALFSMVISMGFSACKKEDDSSSGSVAAQTITQGQWQVTHFSENGIDETTKFDGYVFRFSSNGTVTATRSATVVSGTWSTGNDDSQLKLVLNFSTGNFTEISDDWHILNQTTAKIRLEDVSGGNGGTDLLTFEKV